MDLNNNNNMNLNNNDNNMDLNNNDNMDLNNDNIYLNNSNDNLNNINVKLYSDNIIEFNTDNILDKIYNCIIKERFINNYASTYYVNQNIKFIIPAIIITGLSSIGSFIATNSLLDNNEKNYVNISIGVLTACATILQSISSSFEFKLKAEAFQKSADSYDTLLTKLDFEMYNPNEDFDEFCNKIELEILDIKNKCKFLPPLYIYNIWTKKKHNLLQYNKYDKINYLNFKKNKHITKQNTITLKNNKQINNPDILSFKNVKQTNKLNTQLYNPNILSFENVKQTNKLNTQLDNPITQLDNPITQLDNPITQLDNPITQLDNPITQLDNPITQLDNPITQLDNPITQLGNSITQLDNPITQLDNPNPQIINRLYLL